MVNINNPLIDSPPQEVPLKNAPLVRVIAQMRFPPILSIEKKEFSQMSSKLNIPPESPHIHVNLFSKKEEMGSIDHTNNTNN